MPGQKRKLEEKSSTRKSKKAKLDKGSSHNRASPSKTAPIPVSDEVDFPRGGGTTFNPLEVKAIRAEAVKEADKELFEVRVVSLF
jgi:rRNA biogenesis protein RRP5